MGDPGTSAGRAARSDAGEPAPLLACPHCGAPLRRDGRTWRCAAGHAFDVARQGYVNLLAGRKASAGDTAAMLDARQRVLGAGHLDVVTGALVTACTDLPAGALVEVGAGTAHHLVAVRHALARQQAIAMDVSVAAAKRAGRADPDHTTAVVADVWQPWPLLDAVAAAVLTVFAPRNAEETARVLVPGGRLVVVTPAPNHLHELRGPLGLLRIESGKADRLHAELDPHLDHLDTREVRDTVRVDRADAAALAGMGPAGHHVESEELRARAAALDETAPVTIAVEVSRFARRR
ncbi:putative RNA methyltransferase [Egicoccus sp. AB-alg2]|uniref:putative RNA methyltransferase n=1 Tax=Egicoccus sp. AB-alg2 TaxID=3242693 RepID=UPI00359D496B